MCVPHFRNAVATCDTPSPSYNFNSYFRWNHVVMSGIWCFRTAISRKIAFKKMFAVVCSPLLTACKLVEISICFFIQIYFLRHFTFNRLQNHVIECCEWAASALNSIVYIIETALLIKAMTIVLDFSQNNNKHFSSHKTAWSSEVLLCTFWCHDLRKSYNLTELFCSVHLTQLISFVVRNAIQTNHKIELNKMSKIKIFVDR